MLSLGMKINNNAFGHLFEPMSINGIGQDMVIFAYYKEAWMVGLQPLPFYNICRQKSHLNTKKGITWNYEMILCFPLILIIESELQYIPRIVNLVNEVDSYTPPFLVRREGHWREGNSKKIHLEVGALNLCKAHACTQMYHT